MPKSIGKPRQTAPLDVHRTLIDETVRAKILKLALAAEPVSIRIIAKRFGLSYKSVWQVVSEHVKHEERRGLGPETNKLRTPAKKLRRKKRLGLAFKGSQDFTR